MAPGISYDDSGSLASYFGVTFLALLLIPSTWYVLRPTKKDSLKPLCPCSDCQTRSSRLSASQGSAKTRRFVKRTLPLLLGWTLFIYLCSRIIQAPPDIGGVVYNPFEILGLSDSSSEKQIKKHYKKLSLQFHPDKIKLADNQTKEEADAKFVDLTKAYKALTDEVTRENLAKYGNPDGPQQREDKIAIPQWVVEGKNSIWVLGAYGLVLGGGIPFVVGRWWFSQRSMTRDGILNPTAELFFHYLRDDTDILSLVSLLASSLEFVPLLSMSRRGSKKERKDRQARVEELEQELDTKREELGVEEDPIMKKDSRIGVTTAVARRARALLWAHLLRVEMKDKDLQAEQFAILQKTPTLLNALLNISLAHNWLHTSLLTTRLQAALVQALPPSASPLAQFSDISPEAGFELQMTNEAIGRRWCEKAVKKGALPDSAREIAEYWPRLEITHAEFNVVGEKVVTPSAIVQLAFQARYVYPSTPSTTPSLPRPKLLPNGNTPTPPNEEDKDEQGMTESVAEVEDAVTKEEKPNGIHEDVKEKPKNVTESNEDKSNHLPISDGGKKEIGRKGKSEPKRTWPPNGYAHAPRWPQLRKPHFQVLLGDSKLNKVIVQPIRITDLPLPTSPHGLAPESREYTLQFQAPPQANLYSFVLHAISDSFIGADVDRPIMLKVEEPSAEAELSEDEDISDPEEDTLEGQMAMMRGGHVKASAVHGGDDESGSEYESSSDEEGPRRKGKAINEDSSDED